MRRTAAALFLLLGVPSLALSDQQVELLCAGHFVMDKFPEMKEKINVSITVRGDSLTTSVFKSTMKISEVTGNSVKGFLKSKLQYVDFLYELDIDRITGEGYIRSYTNSSKSVAESNYHYIFEDERFAPVAHYIFKCKAAKALF